MKCPDLSKRPWKNIDLMILGFLGIIDDLYLVLSLGFSDSGFRWRLKYTRWRMLKICYWREREEKCD